jgi:hypothetical protein
MREISPAENATCEQYLARLPEQLRLAVAAIRKEKNERSRPVPSARLIDKSKILTPEIRRHIIDQAAILVDENLCGRSDMCHQYAVLVSRALNFLGIDSRAAFGTAIYFKEGREIFRWDHAWVRSGDEFIDGNVDILYENPAVPKVVSIPPYWGTLAEIPSDRRFREAKHRPQFSDADVDNIWWPDFKLTLEPKNEHTLV